MTEKCRKGVVATFVVLLASIIFSSGIAFGNDSQDSSFHFGESSFSSSSANERKILELVNEVRIRNRAGSLVWDARLGNVARAYSNKMADENFFGHRDSNGKNLLDRITEFKINDWSGIGENLYYCQGMDNPSEAAVAGWLRSSGHKANLLKRDWKSTGIGVGMTSDGKYYVTQVFMK